MNEIEFWLSSYAYVPPLSSLFFSPILWFFYSSGFPLFFQQQAAAATTAASAVSNNYSSRQQLYQQQRLQHSSSTGCTATAHQQYCSGSSTAEAAATAAAAHSSGSNRTAVPELQQLQHNFNSSGSRSCRKSSSRSFNISVQPLCRVQITVIPYLNLTNTYMSEVELVSPLLEYDNEFLSVSLFQRNLIIS